MYNIMKFISNDKTLRQTIPEPSESLLRAFDLYFMQDFEQVISECAPICESLLRQICERESIKCNTNNMFDMLEKIQESELDYSKIELSYLQIVRIMMNKKRHGSLDAHIIGYFDAYTAIIATVYLVLWYVERYYGLKYSISMMCDFNNTGETVKSRERMLIELIESNQYPMMADVLKLLCCGKRKIDDLVNDLGASRMVILKTVLALLESGYIIWDEEEIDTIKINDDVYNNRFVIERCIYKNNE